MLEELISENREQCAGFDAEYCEGAMCAQCPLCEKNIALEYHKSHLLCPTCSGTGIVSRLYTQSWASTTKTCNVCGGTGRYPGDTAKRKLHF